MKRILFTGISCLFTGIAIACTTFCINKNGQIIFGRNYDWVTGAGIINTNQRGLFKTSFRNAGGATISWTSRFGSISFNQYGKEFPTGGMNERGLVVEQMWLDGTVYPAADNRPAIGVLQWIQYQLDNSATVSDVITSDNKLRISDNDTPLHYLVADASGDVATIEFLNGKMVVHKGSELPFPVLTNDRYDISVKTATPILKPGSVASVPGNNSLDRFVKACSMVKQFSEVGSKHPVTDQAFSILNTVAQGDFTKWSIVYDVTNRMVYFKTAAYPSIKSIRFTAFDLSCRNQARMYNMNQPGSGDISNAFTFPDKNVKQSVLHQAVTEGSDRVPISKKGEESLLNYEYSTACKLD